MANNYRNESRRQPPFERWGTPGTQYPTPNPYDVVITEEVTNRAQVFEPVLFGTPHPTLTTALLCFQGQVKSNNHDKAPIRVYANPRLAQEPYNLVNKDDEANDSSYPKFVRSYLLPRGYTGATKGQPLSALIGLTLVSGGTGYGTLLSTPGYGKLALAFSGGAGTGAAGFAEVAAGIIVAVVLTNTGSGYTSAPTVSVTDPGSGESGASITALVQLQSALLVDEIEEPAEDPFAGYFVRVTRIWERYPGVTLTGKTQASEAMGENCNTSTQIIDNTTATTPPTQDYKLLAWTDEAVDANRKRRTTLIMPESAFPILNFSDVDQATGIRITGTKQIVAATPTPSPTGYQELQALDKWRSIMISPALDASSLPGGEAGIETPTLVRHSFPDILSGLTMDIVINGSSGAIDLGMRYNLTEGYSGPCEGTITEIFLTSAQYASYVAPSVTKYIPQSSQFYYFGIPGSAARIWEFRTPLALHAAIAVGPTELPDYSGAGLTGPLPAGIPATVPTGYSSGNEICIDVQIEKWRMGVRRILETRVLIP